MAYFKVLSQSLPQGNACTSVRIAHHTDEIRTQGLMNTKHEFYPLNLIVQLVQMYIRETGV
jgi:hypothetical protein